MNKRVKAFTLVETMVALVVFSFIIGAIMTVYISSQKSKQRVDAMTQAQQASRIAIDFMIKDIRAAGYNIDLEEDEYNSPQRRIVYAGPYTFVFNANIKPVPDDPENPLEPRSINVAVASPKLAPYYVPPRDFQTGAETYVYTLDWNGDGAVNATDRTLSPAQYTTNPNDYALIRRIYGGMDDGTNVCREDIVSVIAGPDQYPSPTTGRPLFMYWYDDDGDPTTPLKLHGDTDGDGELSSAEQLALVPITYSNLDKLDKIELVTVGITGVSPKPIQGEYLSTYVQTDVAVTRNASIKVFLVKGHVYEDADGDSTYSSGESGLAGFKVRLNTGEVAITDSTGLWTFALIPGSYNVSCTPQLLYTPTSELNFDFSVTNGELDFTTDAVYKKYFGFMETPAAYVYGVTFVDYNGDGLFDPYSEEGLGNVQISCWNNATNSYETPEESIGVFLLTINANEDVYVWATPPYGYASSGVDSLTSIMPSDPSAVLVSIINEGAAVVNVAEDAIRLLGFGLVEATGTPPTVRVLFPNGGELLRSGNSYVIKTYATPNDSGGQIVEMRYYYSVNGGDNWKPIDNALYPSNVNDTFSFTWNIPDDEVGSQICLVKVEVIDDGNWTISDQSDGYFTIVGEEGYQRFFFTDEYIDSLYDDTLFLYSLGVTDYISHTVLSGPLPRYLNTVNSYSMGIVGDSIEENGTVTGDTFYTQLGQYAEFATKKGMPYAETIFPGTWKFTFYGFTDAYDYSNAHFEVAVFKTDSTGRLATRQLLFSTLAATTYLSKYASNITNVEAQDTVIVTVPNGFSMDISDRLYVKLYYSGYFTNTGGPSSSISPKIQCHFGGEMSSTMSLPPKQ